MLDHKAKFTNQPFREQEEAQKLYVEFVQRLVEPKGNNVTVSGITVDVKDGVRLITLNRPEKRNALTKKVRDWTFMVHFFLKNIKETAELFPRSILTNVYYCRCT